MKVLQVINSLSLGGAEKLIVDSIPLYKEGGVDVDLLVLKFTDSFFFKELEKKCDIKVLTKGSLYSPLLVFKLLPYLRKYDIIHVHLFPAFYWIVLAKLFSFSKVKVVFTEHNSFNRRRKNPIFKAIDRFIYNRMDFIGCISTGVKESLVRSLKPRTQLDVIYNGIDLDKFYSCKDTVDFSFDIINPFVLCQVSSFTEQKDQITVIKALQFLPSNVCLVLVGTGKLETTCQNLVVELNLENRVNFLGRRNDIPAILNSVDVVVLSSHYEGFGLAIVEGMACEKPVIASNVSGIDEIVHSYGMLFEAGNVDDLTKNVLELYENINYKEQVASKCKGRSMDFDIKNMVDKYKKVYNEI